jgi:flavin reductase (DIM6/NTAB) family NADH-FMN oxidoreductase RutF
MFYEPPQGHGLRYDPFKAIVAPRPIGWISTLNEAGIPNLAPYSFFNAVSGDPPMVGFASEGRKDTVTNILTTGEFVINLATRPMVEQMVKTGTRVDPGTSEFDFAKLSTEQSLCVKPPRVAGCPAALECRMVSTQEIVDLAGRNVGRWFTIGQVVGVHIDNAFIKNGRFDTRGARIVARCGYRDYAEITEMFEMVPPIGTWGAE